MTIEMTVKETLFTEGCTSTRIFATIPITDGSTSEWRSLFVQPVYNVKAGERFEINADGQSTIPDLITYNIDATSLIEIRTAHTDGEEDIQDGSNISIWHGSINAPEGGNINLAEDHHQGIDEEFSFTAPSDYAVLYLTLRYRARSSAAESGDELNIDNLQGQLKYKRYR